MLTALLIGLVINVPALAVWFICALLLSWVARALMGVWGVEEPIRTTAWVVLVLILILWLLQILGIAIPGV